MQTVSELRPEEALLNVTAADGLSVYASSDVLFRNAIFGRDSLEVAEDLMGYNMELAKNILLTLAELQGQNFNTISEEEPGKILHEYRPLYIKGKLIDAPSRRIYRRLTAKWGNEGKRMVYYGSVDSTPLFIRTLAHFCRVYGDDILQQTVTLKDGKTRTMLQVLDHASQWLIAKLADSPLLGYRRLNKQGIANQAWKDSGEFYIHTNGQLANHKRPIASIEVQGLTYDALIAGAIYLPKRAKKLRKLAKELQRATVDQLWQEDKQYFALGQDHDNKGIPRIIATKTANPAGLLDSAIFDDLPALQRQKCVEAIAVQVFSDDFLTDAGVRSRALSENSLVPYWDYHGSFVTWPKETYDIAKGLRRQGLPKLAQQLENRLLNVNLSCGEYPEFIYVDDNGKVLCGPFVNQGDADVHIDSTNRPQQMQAWTISAILAIKSNLQPRSPMQQPWQSKLEAKLLEESLDVPIIEQSEEVLVRYPRYSYRLSPPALRFSAA